MVDSLQYIGVKSTKIVCKNSCNNLGKVKPTNKVIFSSLAEAAAKNFTKCAKCFYKSSKILQENISTAEFKSVMATPIGKLTFLFKNNILTQILFDNDASLLAETNHIPTNNNHLVFQKVATLITKYFNQEKVDFSSIPVSLIGTSFQQEVFIALANIQYGETLSYQDFTKKYFKPLQLRAVSSQIGKNPLPIIFPCHRVIGANNSLTGFFGGIAKKRELLALEGHKNTWQG